MTLQQPGRPWPPALLLLLSLLFASLLTISSSSSSKPTATHRNTMITCIDPRQHYGYIDACSCVLSQQSCYASSSFKYVRFFFCTSKWAPMLGYAGLIAWLLLLFYLLGTTAADYFSCTIEKLSEHFRLSPPVAGVSLLAFGNGAPDVFSSIAAVISSGTGTLGLSSVLGGSIFVITVVSGSLGIATASAIGCTTCVKLDRYSFFRDVFFFLVSLGVLAWIISDGKIYWAEALSFLCIYIAYAVLVVIVEIVLQRNRIDPLLQPLLEDLNAGGSVLPHVAIYAHQDPICKHKEEHCLRSFWGRHLQFFYKYGVKWPLNLPRRLTIPIVQQHRWSRPYAVASCGLAPLFLAFFWYFKTDASARVSAIVIGTAGLLAAVLGPLAFFSTEPGRPPGRFKVWWLAAGFAMSVVWVYFIAQELVAVLLSLGTALDIDSSILGLTVLAWGNSVGDLVGNLCLAYNARDGVQIAMSGCYAGPMFNTVVGLGVSSLLASWRSPLFVSEGTNLLWIIVFAVIALVWALIMVPARKMRLTRAFGVGLLSLYAGFLFASATFFSN